MLICNAEFDNDFASPLSPRKFLEKYVFSDNVKFIGYNKETNTAIYDVFSGEIKVMTMRLKKLQQI